MVVETRALKFFWVGRFMVACFGGKRALFKQGRRKLIRIFSLGLRGFVEQLCFGFCFWVYSERVNSVVELGFFFTELIFIRCREASTDFLRGVGCVCRVFFKSLVFLIQKIFRYEDVFYNVNYRNKILKYIRYVIFGKRLDGLERIYGV